MGRARPALAGKRSEVARTREARGGRATRSPRRGATSGRFSRCRIPPPPAVNNTAWAKTSIDRFVLAELERAACRPRRRPTSGRCLRRLSFDLIGLPPTPEEVDAFVADDSPDAFERVVDRLLASPRYGERWGRHWLDVARYADTKGYVLFQGREFSLVVHLSRLRRAGLQRRPALRPVRRRATGRRPAAARRPTSGR